MNHKIPQGFTEIPPYGPFNELVGSIYGCMRDGMPVLGMLMETKHSNRSKVFMHGGMVSTLADNAMIWGLRELGADQAFFVTTHLSVDFIAAIECDGWIEARVTYGKCGKQLHFAECFIYVNDKIAAKANGQFMVVGNIQADRS